MIIGYQAAPGWDTGTGWGSPDVQVLVPLLARDGVEVDLVLETGDGRVAAFEVKAGARIKEPDLDGLRLLRDRLGDRFAGGFVLNLGDLAYRKEDRISVLPSAVSGPDGRQPAPPGAG